MNSFILRVDSRGRVSLPVRIRARLRVLEGEELVAEILEEGLLIRKKRDRWTEMP